MNNLIFTPDQKLLALSWKQPYAELMLHDKIETRTWQTKYRRWVLMCASKQSYNWNQIANISGNMRCQKIREILLPYFYQNIVAYQGFAIAIGYLAACRPMQPDDEDKCFVKYNPDLFCHIYDNVQAIEPFPWKGSQGWREVDSETKKRIKMLH
jgi:hypothetical protein